MGCNFPSNPPAPVLIYGGQPGEPAHSKPGPQPHPLEERFDHFLEVRFTPGPQNFVGDIALLVDDESKGH